MHRDTSPGERQAIRPVPMPELECAAVARELGEQVDDRLDRGRSNIAADDSSYLAATSSSKKPSAPGSPPSRS